MAYQEVTKTSYGKRLGNSSKGIFLGFLMIIAAAALLWWNEGRAVKMSKMYKQAKSECVELTDVNSIDPSFEGKLVHAVAPIVSDRELKDPTYPISVKAIRLNRKVEYYQWEEKQTTTTRDKTGGGQETITTYTYEKRWTPSPVNSSNFKDPEYQNRNSVKITVSDFNTIAPNVTFGAYKLPSDLLWRLPFDTHVELPEEMADGQQTYILDNVLYYCDNLWEPQIGDVRVTFTMAPEGDASIIGKVIGDTFEPYNSYGKSLLVLKMGSLSANNMFNAEKSADSLLRWFLRLVGLLLAIGGFRKIFELIVTAFKVLPPLANIVSLGINLVTAVLGFVWSLIFIVVATIAYRKWLAIILLVIAVGLILFLLIKGGLDADDGSDDWYNGTDESSDDWYNDTDESSDDWRDDTDESSDDWRDDSDESSDDWCDDSGSDESSEYSPEENE